MKVKQERKKRAGEKRWDLRSRIFMNNFIYFSHFIIIFFFHFLGVVNQKKLPVMTRVRNEKIWIPRSKLLEAFLARIDGSKNIKVLFSSKCDNIESKHGQVSVSVHSNDNSYDSKILSPGLLLGCDGISSVVRTWLSDNENKSGHVEKDQTNKFDPISIPSVAAGLRYKMLTLEDR